MNNFKRKQRGFTLIELLVVIGLLAITVGVSTDIILSIVRSYSKNKITTEIEQAGNIAMLKMEKELKKATRINRVGSSGDSPVAIGSQISFNRQIDGNSVNVVYGVGSGTGSLVRIEDYGSQEEVLAGDVEITNSSDAFTWVSSNPDVVKIRLVLQQSDETGNPAFAGEVTLEQVLVLRGTYQ